MDKKFYCVLLLIAVIGLVVHVQFWRIPAAALRQEDIYYIWLEGKRIVLGENPYARVLEGNLRVNDKYATYFPMVYIFSAVLQKLGFTEFRDWLIIWRPLSYLFHMGTVTLILRAFQQRGAILLGFVASMMLLLGRWSLYVVTVHHIEFAAIFFLILSLVWLHGRSSLALIMYSLSLAIKQIGIFLLPLYVIHLFKAKPKSGRFKAAFLGFVLIVSIPVLVSVPFLWGNAEGYLKSILFSATRLGSLHIEAAPSIDVLAANTFPWIVGLRAKALMLFLMGITFLSFWKEKINIFISSSITMMTFLYFNSVLFLQYFVWPLSLILLAFAMTIETPRKGERDKLNREFR